MFRSSLPLCASGNPSRVRTKFRVYEFDGSVNTTSLPMFSTMYISYILSHADCRVREYVRFCTSGLFDEWIARRIGTNRRPLRYKIIYHIIFSITGCIRSIPIITRSMGNATLIVSPSPGSSGPNCFMRIRHVGMVGDHVPHASLFRRLDWW